MNLMTRLRFYLSIGMLMFFAASAFMSGTVNNGVTSFAAEAENVLINGDFESTGGWGSPNGPFVFTNEENYTAGGSRSLKVNPGGNLWSTFFYMGNDNSGTIPVTKNATYRVSFWHKGSDNGQLEVADYGIPNGNIVANADVEWTYYYKDFYVGTRNELSRLQLKNNNGSAVTASYFDDFKTELIAQEPESTNPVHEADEMHSVERKTEDMKIGTNFWFLAPSWTGEKPMKSGINWTTAYSAQTDIWNPVFINELSPYTNLRFMDWGSTNGSAVISWNQRTLPNNAYNGEPRGDNEISGLAYEWMIDLCNRTNKDMWICIPHKANDDYVQNLAQLIKDKLNPDLRCYVEYSNEIWNWMFPQTTYCNDKGKEIFSGVDWPFYDYAVYRSFQIFKIFNDVYGTDMASRVKRVCAFSGSMDLFDSAYGRIYNSSAYNPSHQKTDIMACAPYIGHGINGYGSDVVNQFHSETDKTLYSYVIPASNIAKKYSAELDTYEGGQHLLSGAQVLSADPRMYEEYVYMLNTYSPYFTLFNHYAHCGSWSSGGAWGALDHTGQSVNDAPKYRALTDWAKEPLHERHQAAKLPYGQLRNASFQDGLSGWTAFLADGSWSVKSDETRAHYLEITGNNGSNAGSFLLSSCKLIPSREYVLYYDVRGSKIVNGNTETSLVNVDILDKATLTKIGGKNWGGQSWGQRDEAFVSPSDGEVTIRVVIPGDGNAKVTIAVDHFGFALKGEARPDDPALPTEETDTPGPTPSPGVTPVITITPDTSGTPVSTPTQGANVAPTPSATGKPTASATANKPKTYTAYVPISKISVQKPNGKYKTTAKTALYKKASDKKGKIKALPKSRVLTVISVKGSYAKVKIGKTTGYVKMNVLSFSKSQNGSVLSNTYAYKYRATGKGSYKKLKKKTKIVLMQRIGNYYAIKVTV